MIRHLFTTDIIHEKTGLSDDLLDSVVKWAEAQQFDNVAANDQRATKHGRQFEPQQWPWVSMPMWKEIHQTLGPYVNDWVTSNGDNLQKINITSWWFVFYEKNGFQEPHLHPGNSDSFTIILGLEGEGELLLHDPRLAAVKAGWKVFHPVTVKKGDVLIMPSWLIHSSSPCDDTRTIMVLDGTAN